MNLNYSLFAYGMFFTNLSPCRPKYNFKMLLLFLNCNYFNALYLFMSLNSCFALVFISILLKFENSYR